jgi:hypothetical protein
MYLINRTPLDHLGEVCALDHESSLGGLAAQMHLTSPCLLSTHFGLFATIGSEYLFGLRLNHLPIRSCL